MTFLKIGGVVRCHSCTLASSLEKKKLYCANKGKSVKSPFLSECVRITLQLIRILMYAKVANRGSIKVTSYLCLIVYFFRGPEFHINVMHV